ncbi:MAG TPA: hypothetical protein VHG71_02925 [Verrucomicrobiae bacterium]|nr:hypothetical protein [Verrucomicrobiae bacterium]
MNSGNPKSTWIRIVIAAGVMCAAISSCSYIFLIIVWRMNGSWGRFYDRTVGPITLATMLATLICGIILLKHSKRLAKILITIGIVVLILGLLTPEL